MAKSPSPLPSCVIYGWTPKVSNFDRNIYPCLIWSISFIGMHYCQKESENERHNRQRPHFEVDWLNEPMCPAKNWLLSEWLAAFSVGPACWASIQMVISPISYILVHYYIQHIYILCIVICFGPTALFTCWVGSNHTNDKTTFWGVLNLILRVKVTLCPLVQMWILQMS